MMNYKPSPRPNYSGPTVIRYEDVACHLWGDETSGRVADWIYISNEQIHALLYGLAPGGSFNHSKEFRTVFGADEVMVVTEGTLALANPETGEVMVAHQGEAIAFRKNTWHHGFNIGEGALRVLEFFSPPPSQGTSGSYARTRPYLSEADWHYLHSIAIVDFPFANHQSSRTLFKLTEDNLKWELRGLDQKILVGYFINTQHLSSGRIYLSGGARLMDERHEGDEITYVESGKIFIYLPELPKENWIELRPSDAFYVPAGIKHEYHNLSQRPARLLFAVAPNEYKREIEQDE
jgi:quercetin dioxygenase-like cupin family protein